MSGFFVTLWSVILRRSRKVWRSEKRRNSEKDKKKNRRSANEEKGRRSRSTKVARIRKLRMSLRMVGQPSEGCFESPRGVKNILTCTK